MKIEFDVGGVSEILYQCLVELDTIEVSIESADEIMREASVVFDEVDGVSAGDFWGDWDDQDVIDLLEGELMKDVKIVRAEIRQISEDLYGRAWGLTSQRFHRCASVRLGGATKRDIKEMRKSEEARDRAAEVYIAEFDFACHKISSSSRLLVALLGKLSTELSPSDAGAESGGVKSRLEKAIDHADEITKKADRVINPC